MKLCGHFCSCSSNGRLRSFLTPRRSSCDHPWISFSIAYNAAIRSSASAAADLCVTECRRTSSVGAPNKPLLDPLKLLQVLFWMFSLAIRRVSEPYRRWCGISRWSIVSHIRPQPSGLGLAQACCCSTSHSGSISISWLVPATQSANVARSSSTPSRPKISACRYKGR